MVLHLTVSLAGSGYHPASWRASRSPPGPNAAAFRAMARTAERGKLDAILLGLPVGATGEPGTVNTLRFDPLPLLGSLIGVTERIGLGGAWTVDYTEPYHVARVFATLDHLSYGRTCWIATMFGTDALVPRIGRQLGTADLAEYCQRAGEFIDTVKQLWDSWEDEAFALDKASGMFGDPDRVHPIHHDGKFFTVRGPLNVPRPPQGNPVLVQCDPATETGRQLATATADVVLTDCASLPDAIARYRALRSRAELRVLANVSLVLGETAEAAQDRADSLDRLALPASSGLRFIGTPEQLVDLFATWHEQGACDGFNLLPAVLPDDLDMLVDAVIPLAQMRGLRRADYSGTTLREHLGLSRPRSQYTAHATEHAGS